MTYDDFYYGRLLDNEKEIVRKSIPKEYADYIDNLKLKKDQIYLRLTPKLIDILSFLNFREILFSTFYFSKKPCLIWGNYKGRYPVFYLNKNIMEYYKSFQLS